MIDPDRAGGYGSPMRRRATLALLTVSVLLAVLSPAPLSAAPRPRGGQGSVESDARAYARSKALPPLVQATARDALTGALAEGRISAGRYALERVVSLFDLRQVRARFGRVSRPDPRSATLLFRDLALRVDQLPATERRVARRILARPTDGDVSLGHAYTVSEEAPLCAANTCVHYVGSTDDAPPPDDVDTSGVPDYVEAASAIMEDVWAAEVGALGYRAPKSDLTSTENGGNALLDVYLVDIGADGGLYGFCASDDPNLDPSSGYQSWDMSAYCVLDDDYDISQFPGYPDPMDPLKVTAAHEFFHAVQFAYDIAEDRWFMESSATWIEDEVYDAIDDNRQFLAFSPLTQPLIPLDRNTCFRVYGVWIFWRFLAEYLGGATPDPSIVLDVWERADGAPGGPDRYSTQATAQAVAARVLGGTPWRLRWAFADFAVWNARPGKYYDEGAAYPTAAVAKTVTLTRAVSSTTSTVTLDHLTNRYVVVRRGSGLKATARLRVTINGPGYGTGPEASVLVIRKSGTAGYRIVNLNTAGDGAVTVALDTTVSRVVVIVTNASTRYTNCYSGTTPFACLGGSPVDENRSYTFRAAVV
jgi:hypothetical protein